MTPPPPSTVAEPPPTGRNVPGFEYPRPRSGAKLADVIYPDSDGQPMAENTLQFHYIVLLKQGFEHFFADREDVFVAGDLLWYPVEGEPTIRFAPDVMVAFGRPKGYRGSYRQWEEGGIPPEFVIEVISPGNRAAEMGRKAAAYLKYGAKEYVIYDPDRGTLEVLVKDAMGDWEPVPDPNGWRSELTGIRFFLEGKSLIAVRPDGKKFEDYEEVMRRAAEEARQKNEALKVAEESSRQKNEALARAAALEAKLRAAGIEP
ncbi:MAG: Uma2 family endonuclease [Verrucomicrobiales bacterium]